MRDNIRRWLTKATLFVPLFPFAACDGSEEPGGPGVGGSSAGNGGSSGRGGGRAGASSGGLGGNAQAAAGGLGGEGGSGAEAGSATTGTAEGTVTPDEGGMVTLGSASVAVPPGAVSEPVTLRLSEVDPGDIAALPSGYSRIGTPIALEPHGHSFDEPVVITLGHDGSAADERGVLRLDDEDDVTWAAVTGARFAARTVSFESRTFSIVVPVGNSSGGGTGGAAGKGGGGAAGKGGSAGGAGAGGALGGAGGAGAGGAGASAGGATGGAGAGGAQGGAGAGGIGGGGAVPTSSCEGMTGTECSGHDCCASLAVPGGSFLQGPDPNAVIQPPGDFAAVVGDYWLDKFEVTVGRFRRFVAAYASWRAAGNPASGAGAHPRIAGTGWVPVSIGVLPLNTAIMTASCHAALHTWVDGSGNETLPINCVTWHVAAAFCIWDGGRLPTEAEFEYAMAGGSEDRTYPWGEAAPDGTRAVYGCMPASGASSCALSDLLSVGSKPAGDGRWGQSDLAGSLHEWTFDWYAEYDEIDRVTEYANTTAGTYRMLRGGYYQSSLIFDVDYRVRGQPSERHPAFGFRCARDTP